VASGKRNERREDVLKEKERDLLVSRGKSALSEEKRVGQHKGPRCSRV